MRRPRSGIGAELVPLVLILACLAGSLAMIYSVHRRFASRKAPIPAVVLGPLPAPPKPAPPRPAPTPIIEPASELTEPEPPPPPAPEDPTPKALAKLTSAEAEQLLEASRADRKAAALEAARKSALLESERWRRRESLIHLQLDSLDAKVRKMETQADELALERDALEKELDARKAMAAQARSRPSQAILPHRGANGTWRRPIVVECVNGMAILQPHGVGFGLLDLASGFGPASNPFVATIAREAIRIQGNASPDGQPVVPYIFFLVRPDGIRPYYEARGRLEPLGITFGYELADQDWVIDFPDLDDMKTWDGSAPALPSGMDPLAQSKPLARGASPAEDEEFPSWGASRRGRSPSSPIDGPGGEFVWPPRSPALDGNGGGVKLGNLSGSGSGTGFARGGGGLGASARLDDTPSAAAEKPDGPDPLSESPSGAPAGLNVTSAGTGPLAGGPGRVPDGPTGSKGHAAGLGSGVEMGTVPTTPPAPGAPGELALSGSAISPLPTPGISASGSAGGQVRSGAAGGQPSFGAGPPASPGNPGNQEPGNVSAKDDPANSFVWPPKPKPGLPGTRGSLPARPSSGSPDSSDPPSPDQSPPVRHVGPFSRPLAMGLDPVSSSNPPPSADSSNEADPTQPDGSGASGTPNLFDPRKTGSQGRKPRPAGDRAGRESGGSALLRQPGEARREPPLAERDTARRDALERDAARLGVAPVEPIRRLAQLSLRAGSEHALDRGSAVRGRPGLRSSRGDRPAWRLPGDI